MKAAAPFLLALPLALAACNVERDPANDTTAISVNEAKVDRTLDAAGNAVRDVAGEVKDAAREAKPGLEKAADDAGATLKDAGQTVKDGADRAAADVRQETREADGNRN